MKKKDVEKQEKKVKTKKTKEIKKEKDTKKSKSNVKEKKNTKKTKKGLGIVNYFKDVKKEVSHVKWPDKKEMVKYSIATIVFIIFFALFFYLIEVIFALLKSLV